MAYEIKFAESVKDQLKAFTARQRQKILDSIEAQFVHEPLILTDKDRLIAAIVSLENVDRESLFLGTNPKFLEIIKRAEDEFKAGKTLSLEEMKREVLGEE